jgi:anaerobic dimethyl sulfoxide reductase subunit A
LDNPIKTAGEHRLSRRSFLGWSAAATGTAVLLGSQTGLIQLGDGTASAAAPAQEGKWVSAACWHNCGGKCLNKALVREGVVIRQKTDDTHPDSPDTPQQRGCARGRSQRQQVLGADRLKYPMKRKNWAPGGGKKELRGIDEWERISWDEALDLVAGELKRIKGEVGNKGFVMPRINSKLMNAYGGAMTTWGVGSDGSWPQVEQQMTGGSLQQNDRLDWRNARLIVLWGSNPAWSSAGSPAYNLLQAKKAGAKIICVDPMYGATHQMLADEWIPVRPGTDAALLLGMAHHMITEGLYDKEFIKKYTVGFDYLSMPSGTDFKENFKDYVLGTHDKMPKTPEWASEICGTDPDVIRHFATEICSVKPMIWTSTPAPARTHRGEQFCQAFLTVGWMTGNVGISGGGVWKAYHSNQSYGSRTLVSAGGTGAAGVANPVFPYAGYGFADPDKDNWWSPAYEELYDAILKGQYHRGVHGMEKCDIRAIYSIRTSGGGNFLNQSANINKGIEAIRKVEFFVTSDIVLSTVSKYADIVLPETTWWEKVGTVASGNPEAIVVNKQVIEPRFEARDGEWIERELAKRLGLDPLKVHSVDMQQQFFNQIAGAKVMKKDGSGMEPLVTITDADIAAMKATGKPQQGRISMAELLEQGVYQVERREGDNFGFIAMKAFRDDPVKNPLKTKSGKLEIHCQSLANKIAQYGFSKCAPIAQYTPPEEGYETTFADFKAKKKGEFPLQLFTIHYPRRSHSTFDNIRQLREAFPQEFYMNPADAAERGIKEGDTVKITSPHGAVIRPVYLTERIMPGVVTLPQGAWVERDEKTLICKAGATNVLSGTHLTGQGEEPWNTVNVQVEKWTGETLAPDVTWPQRIML